MNASGSLNAQNFRATDISLGQSFLLAGTDSYLVESVLDKLRLTLKKSDGVDTTIIYGDEVKSSVLAEHLDTFSIFSSSKLIIIRNAEKMDSKELDTLAMYFDSPSDIQSVVVVTEKIDARFSAWKKIKSSSTLVTCDPPRYSSDIKTWLIARCAQMSKTMDSKAIEAFINRVELDFFSAANELNKLDLLSQGRTRITETDVLKSLGTSRSGTLIDFYRAMGNRQLKKSLEALDKMLCTDWEPLQVFYQFYKFYLIIWRILLLKKAHISENEIISKHLNDIFQTQRRDYVEFSKSYNIASIEAIFAILLDTDAQFKLSVADTSVLLCSCLVKVLEA